MFLRLCRCICLGIFLVSVHAPLWAKAPGKAAVASAHPLATQAGHEVLAAGGNAFDAAIAVAAALAVVEPYGSGIGGGGFFLLHRAEDQHEVVIDAREKAPLKATADMYLDENGRAIEKLSKEGPMAAGIPGMPAAFEHLARDYGALPLAKSLAPAIRYATEGFAVGEHYAFMAQMRSRLLKRYEEGATIFLPSDGEAKAGMMLKQADLAKTIRLIAEQGAKGFYAGETAERLVKGVQDAGGIWQLDDLKNYAVVERQPLYGEYRGMRITSVGPPSSGGVAMITALNVLSTFNAELMESKISHHLVIEAMRRAYRDRAQYLGDADFVDVPVDKLIHPLYAAGLAASIRADKATPSNTLPGVMNDHAGNNTTHFSVMDAAGNRVSATLSINFPFGSGFVPPGTGVVLNNEMDDFSIKPGVPNGYGLVGGMANAIAPGKRMLSSMSPSFLETKDRLAIIGTPGGSRIITMVLLGALEFYDSGNAKKMVSLPRIHHQFLPDVVTYEPDALSRNEKLELQLLGHVLRERSRPYGNMQVVVWDKKRNKVSAASDPRGEGLAEVK